MMHLIRVKKKDKTDGILISNDVQFKTDELVWDDNKRSVSCIPDGIYPFRNDFSANKDRFVLELYNVPNRSQIQIHANGRLEGCIGIEALGVGETNKEAEALLFEITPPSGYINITTIE